MTPLNQLFQIRDQLINIYKRYERFIMPALKFILTVSVLLMINNTMGYAQVLTKTTVTIIIGLVGVFLPPQLIMLFLMLIASFHAASGSIEAGIMIFALLLIIYLLFVRLYPVESLFIIGVLIAYKLHIPYIVPLIAGLFSSLASIIAVIVGILIWYCAPEFIIMMQTQSAEMSDVVEVINAKIITLQEVFKTDKTMLASIVILSVVLLTVYLIQKQNTDYAEYIAILVGAVINLIGFLFSIILLKVEVGIAGLIISTVICGIIATIIQFFSKAADYSRAETVQFEDAQNYYYVKVVPKIIVNRPKRQIQHIYTKDDMGTKSHEN